MTNLPVESMKTGGMAWWSDLTVSDPYFALPVMTCAMLYAIIEVSMCLHGCCLGCIIALSSHAHIKCSLLRNAVYNSGVLVLSSSGKNNC